MLNCSMAWGIDEANRRIDAALAANDASLDLYGLQAELVFVPT
jgi:hypothetical protein